MTKNLTDRKWYTAKTNADKLASDLNALQRQDYTIFQVAKLSMGFEDWFLIIYWKTEYVE